MIVSIRSFMQRLRFIVIFFLATYVVVQLLGVVSAWIAPVNKYREPQGRAVKVFHPNVELDMEPEQFRERLKLYYWLGE
ncbi:YqzK family protein [Paenibacillus sp. SC116]|uniref:YqzK family protein n=1 Tax=Paenibacillus sp. SC116 TaxID=2968986 RepID=UPI00215AB747|nr:YqzK family protein [Paenibacillus sp. SC116]MCR8843033.1 YqzK family protein [Paenibacillus sp. SC116]